MPWLTSWPGPCMPWCSSATDVITSQLSQPQEHSTKFTELILCHVTNDYIKYLLLNIIQPFSSNWASPMVIVPKDGNINIWC